jgi:ketosteroid isomerase-like protein
MTVNWQRGIYRLWAALSGGHMHDSGRSTRECYHSRAIRAGLTLALIGCVLLSLPTPASAPRASQDVNAVEQVIAELTAAELRYDVKAVDRLLDEGFVYVGNDGSLTSRVDFLGLTDRDRNPLELLEITDINVRTTGNTAIATGLIHEKGLINGQPYEFRGRTLNTFVRKAGRWRCLAIHD